MLEKVANFFKKFTIIDSDYGRNSRFDEIEEVDDIDENKGGSGGVRLVETRRSRERNEQREESSVSLAGPSFEVRIHRLHGAEWSELAKDLSDDFLKGCLVVLNTESGNKEAVRRLLDFVGGVAFARDGKIKKVSETNFIIAPHGCDVAGDIYEEQGSSDSNHFIRSLLD